MSSSNVIYDSCRVCLIYKGTVSLTDRRNKILINDMIMEFSDLNLCAIDNSELPKSVCHACLRSLENAVKLKTSIKDSDIKLRKILNIDLVNTSESYDIKEEKPFDLDNILEVTQEIRDFSNENSASSFEEANVNTETEVKKSEKTTKSRYYSRRKPRNNICDECGEGFTNDQKLRKHSLIHKGPRPYKCNLCPKDFIHRNSYDMHKKMHAGLKKFICEYCSKAFLMKHSLDRHITVHLPDSEKKIECQECGLKFHTKKVLKSHSIIHTNIKPFVCNECGHSFYKKVNLESHMDGVHRRIKRYTCPYCNKLYSSSSSLVRHKRIHTGEKPYECQYCDARFNQSTLRVKHHRQHVQRGDRLKMFVQSNYTEATEDIKME